MATAYIETTIPSYYTARNARSILQASRQLATREWWDGGCSGFELVTSTETLNEVGEGDPEMAKARLELLRSIRILPVTEAAGELARALVSSGLVPAIASPDAVHIALASVYQIDFLVTWNFKHIANPHTRERMRTRINDSGFRMPVMCSPEELLNDDESI
jgi:predicted nucleic acid-binding protein